MNKSIIYIWLFTLACVFIQPILVYNELPDRVASKFDGSGHAIAYEEKKEFVIFWLIMAVFVNAVMQGVAALVWKWNPTLVNLPNKNYWLATDERRAIVRLKLSNGMALIGTVCNLLFLAIFDGIYHFGRDGKLPFDMAWLLIGFGIAILGAGFYFITSFRVPKETGFRPGIR